MNRKCLVVGSINIDLVFACNELPVKDKTIIATKNIQSFGGKGNNQAIILNNLGIDTNLLGKVGDDYYGELILSNLKTFLKSNSLVSVSPSKYSGLASINIDNFGNKQIIVDPGANYDLTISDINNYNEDFKKIDLVMTQLELPLVVVEKVLEIAKKLQKITFLNANPGRKLTKKVLENTDYLITNTSDLAKIINRVIETEQDIENGIRHLNKLGVKIIIIKNYFDNYYWNEGTEIRKISFGVIKNTRNNLLADEDCFVSSFVYSIINNKTIEESIIFAVNYVKLIIKKGGIYSEKISKREIDLLFKIK